MIIFNSMGTQKWIHTMIYRISFHITLSIGLPMDGETCLRNGDSITEHDKDIK